MKLTVVSGSKSTARSNYVLLNPSQFNNKVNDEGICGFVRIKHAKDMISAYICSDLVPEGTIHIRSFTHGRTLQIANGDSVMVEEVREELPRIDYLEVFILRRCLAVNPMISVPTFVKPLYFIVCSEGLGLVKKGSGVYMNLGPGTLLDKTDASQNVKYSDDMDMGGSSIYSFIDEETIPSSININFCRMGLGGLKSQMDILVRQVLISRIIPSDMRELYQIKDAKGILLYGPPGTGKTSIARKIGKIIPKSVITNINGPELSSKYYGETEQKVRDIFEKNTGDKLHVIIFDEIDAVGKRRGASGSSGVDDKVLTQLLTMIDGLGPDRNSLVIGITNRKDILDPALLRAGRLGCQIEIPLPTEAGRKEILDIYLKPLRDKSLLEGADTDILARNMDGYSGADIESLVNRAKNLALLRNCDMNDNCIKAKDEDPHKVTMSDILLTMEEFDSTFSKNDAVVQKYVTCYSPELVDKNKIETLKLSLEDVMIKPLVLKPSDLIDDDIFIPTAISEEEERIVACHVACMIEFPYVRYIGYNDFLGMSTRECCDFLQSVYMDCLSSERAVLILDNLEELRDKSLVLRQRFISDHPLEESRKLVIIKMNTARDF